MYMINKKKRMDIINKNILFFQKTQELLQGLKQWVLLGVYRSLHRGLPSAETRGHGCK